MHCPYCRSPDSLRKKGFFSRKSVQCPRIQRFRCRHSGRFSSTQTGQLSEGHRRPELNRPIYLLLASGVSQRRAARLLGTTPVTVARKLVRLSRFAERHQKIRTSRLRGRIGIVDFDEMETFEHSKCKPLAIALAVDQPSRRIIDARVSSMPAKGRLAAIARRRYGYRRDNRRKGLVKILSSVASVARPNLVIRSDMCPRYPSLVKAVLPGAVHKTFKGRRGCVVGQGELKAGGNDPLFSLNQTCAMYRDNIKRLTRRTWCTTKRRDRLQDLVNLYVCAHNAIIDDKETRTRGQRIDFDLGSQVLSPESGAAV